MITISNYSTLRQAGIDDLMHEINTEFSLPATHPDYKPKLPDGYWVALVDNQVVGTVGINKENNYAVLKRMFLKKEFRGKERGIAQQLLQTTFAWCKEKNIDVIYLGTIDRFEAAQRFYEKNGFAKITAADLPSDFPNNPIDNVFYKRNSIR